MAHRSFTERRRRQLALRAAALDQLEGRSTVTPLGMMAAGIGVAAAAGGLQQVSAMPRAAAENEHRRELEAAFIPAAGRRAGEFPGRAGTAVVASGPAARGQRPIGPGDWLALSNRRRGTERTPEWQLLGGPDRPGPHANAGGSQPGRGGSGVAAGIGRGGGIQPIRLPGPTAGTGNTTVVVAPPIFPTAPSGGTGVGLPPAGPPAAPPTPPTGGGGHGGGSLSTLSVSGGAPSDPGLVVLSGGGVGLNFTYFPVYTLDYVDGTLMVPGFVQYGTVGGPSTGWVDLRAQVRDTTVSSYSWDTTNLTQATHISGTSTYRLQFKWGTTATPTTNSVTLTVTDTNGHQEVQTYSFLVPAGTSTVSGGAPTVTWPEALAPNLVQADAPRFASHNVDVASNTGAAETAFALPAYSPNIPPVILQYDSLLADPRPLVVEHHTLDPAQTVPTKVGASLTFNGSSGSTYYYDTSQFNAGAIQQAALQADATALSTGRYSYTVTVADYRATTTTTTVSGTATVLDGSADATHGSAAGQSLGAGWTVAGLEQITTATGGVILDLGGGDSLWFASSGGGYTSPAGDFSTLAAVSGGGYKRTMTDGTVDNFNASGQETSVVDRNGLRTTYTYSSGELTKITDPYGKVTTFTYTSGKLSKITDPANRVVTVTHSGGNLSGVTLPDNSTWAYGYDASGRLTKVTDPRSKVTTVAYDAADRVGTITRPDSTTEEFTAYQERGLGTSTNSASPGAALLLAEARASDTDPNSHTTDLRPDWRGLGLTGTAHDPDGNVTTYDRDANGLPTISIDRLNRVNQDAYDAKGNVTTHTYPDLNKDVSTYNSFAEALTFQNARGYTMSYTYDSGGNLTVIQDALNNRTTMTYTATGQLETLEDARGNVTTYQYDSQDRQTTITHPGGATTKYAYDTEGNPATVTDERGNSTTYSYDALNRKTGMTDALTNRTTYTYDSGGNLTVVQAPLSRTTTYAYDSMNRVTTVTDPLGHNTVYGYDSGGNLTTVTDPLSRVTTYQYDAEDRRTVVIDPLANRTTTAYDAEGQVTQVTDRLGRITTYTYNSRGWVSTRTDPLGNVATYTYTATGQPASETTPGSGGSLYQITYDELDRAIAIADGLGDTTTTVYDAVGNVTAQVDPNNNRTTSTYDARNRLQTVEDPLTHVTTYQYDDAGNRTVVIDPLSHRTTTAYDALNRATTITDALSGQTTIAYDAAGRQVGLTDPDGNHTTWAYDAADRLTTLTDALGTATSSYDAGNQLTDQTDRDGRRTTFAYDADGRQTNERWLNASGGTLRTITYTYDAEGELTGVSDPDATLTFTYDSGGRQATARTSGGGTGQPDVTLTSGYDSLGERTSLVDNLTSVGRTTFAYDAGQRLTTITRSIGGTAGPQILFGYDAANRLTQLDRSNNGSNYPDVVTTLSYDAADRVTTITHGTITSVGSPPILVLTPLATYTYGYDAADRLTSETNAEGSVTYTYDNTNQLTGTSGARSESYGYDSGGNRNTTGYTVSSSNELTASPSYTYTYDAEGNLTGKTKTATGDVWTYTWDYRNRLTGVTEKNSGGSVTLQATYTYDALDRRIGTKVDDDGGGPHAPVQTWTVYDGANTYADFNGSGQVTVRYLYGPAIDDLLARTDSGGTTAWYLADRLGTVRDIANTSGTVIDHIGYDSFGSVTSESSPSNGDRFKFTGREFDAATGLYYFRARYYDPALGRFMSTDPTGFSSGDFNAYRYVENQPTDATDPTGKGFQDAMHAVGNFAGRWTIGWFVDWDGLGAAGNNVNNNFSGNMAGSGAMAGYGQTADEMLAQFDRPNIQSGTAYAGGTGITTQETNRSMMAAVEAGSAATGIARPTIRPASHIDYSGQLTRSNPNATKTLRSNLNTNTAIARAHHIIPLQVKNHPVVQAAARGGFNINGSNNGINMLIANHPQGARHPVYNMVVTQLLDGLSNQKLTDIQAAQAVQNIVNQMRPILEQMVRTGSPLH